MSEYDDFIKQIEAKIPKDQRLIPQEGFQFDFLRTKADICLGGGSAGGGKTYALLMEPTRFQHIPRFAAVTFRRLNTEIKNPNGLWDEAKNMYGKSLGGQSTDSPMTWFFPHPSIPGKRGARVVFTHLQYEKTLENHKGGQYPLIQFDELSTFTERMFFYMLSRNRTDLPMSPYVRATSNPDSSGWLKDMVSWYLYPDDFPDENLAGFPIPERIGKLRYFTRDGGEIIWGDSKEDVINKVPELFPLDDIVKPKDKIKSFTFIPGNVRDNIALMKNDPKYIGGLMMLDDAERRMLLDGCWRFTPGQDDLFDYGATIDCFSNSFIQPSIAPLKKFVTADIALEGADKFVVMLWHGWVVKDVKVYDKVDGKQLVTILKRLVEEWGVPRRNLIYDRDGVGDAVKGWFRSSFGFRGGAAPMEMPEYDKKGEKPNYFNLRAQVYYEMAKKVKEAKVFIDWENSRFQSQLIKELNVNKKAPPSTSGKLRIRDKDYVTDRLAGKSPDFADSFVMRMVGEWRVGGGRSKSSVG